MYFDSTAFGVFLIAVFALFWAVSGRRRLRNGLLLGASWFFYGCWSAKYLSLIGISTLLDYWIGGQLGRLAADDPKLAGRRRLLVSLSLVGNLGLLGIFKYYNFFIDSIEPWLALPHLDVLLPVGISFYTFQTLSYTIDIYRGTLKPAKSLGEFALFVAFFPQLVAGPIVRAADFFPQLELRPSLDRERLLEGLFRIMEGLVKKVVIADVLGAGLVRGVFDGEATGLHALLGVYGYALQIYGDFAGYSDIAIGVALLLGFRIPENFHAPYKSHSIQEFWRRWHISLSTWLRDYLYLPLGGNRRGAVRTYINLGLVMLLGGLWHGASWNFVVWGAMHGGMLGINRWWTRRGWAGLSGKWGHGASVFLTFHLVCLTWVFFAASDFDVALMVLGNLFSSGASGWLHVASLAPSVWFAMGLGICTHFAPVDFKSRLRQRYLELHPCLIGVGWALLFGVLAFSATDSQPFIYFQF